MNYVFTDTVEDVDECGTGYDQGDYSAKGLPCTIEEKTRKLTLQGEGGRRNHTSVNRFNEGQSLSTATTLATIGTAGVGITSTERRSGIIVSKELPRRAVHPRRVNLSSRPKEGKCYNYIAWWRKIQGYISKHDRT